VRQGTAITTISGGARRRNGLLDRSGGQGAIVNNGLRVAVHDVGNSSGEGPAGQPEYLGILQPAAQESEVGVDGALRHLIDRGEAIF
jgi:hypothetical protein